MPLEIRELIIRAKISESESEQSADAPENKGSSPMEDNEDIISECVQQVLEILNNKKER